MKPSLEIRLTLTSAELGRLQYILTALRYGDVYMRMPHMGDGNQAGSASDIETRETLAVLRRLKAAAD